ncbi:hypothetical protein ACIPSA_46700 [Streptomyces sp. NPDC086549]|uniref:hypothetical protein n=1 Tax=Streptomyces sp. NPDC086549 TaxID=3365752 RepID=UPI003801A675
MELAVVYLLAGLIRQAQRTDGRADTELDAALDRLLDLVSGKLGQDDPALERAREEVISEEAPSRRTHLRLAFSLEDAAERDPDFAQALEHVLTDLRAAGAAERDEHAGEVTASGDRAVAATGWAVVTGDFVTVIPGEAVTGPPGPPFGDDEEDD